MNEATPRITAHYLEQFSNRMVRIVGKVVQLRGEEAMIEAGGQIVLHLNRVCIVSFLARMRSQILSLYEDCEAKVKDRTLISRSIARSKSLDACNTISASRCIMVRILGRNLVR